MIRKSNTMIAFVLLMAAAMVACKAPKEASVLEIYKDKKLVEAVPAKDFLAVFTKNNLNNEKLTRESIEEYLDLFINYKLKVKEAEALGMDTLPAFVTELSGYREQLAKPYLTDQTVTDRLIEEAWERMQTDIRASHILVTVAKDASPKDSLKAWNRINEARRLLLAGADFGTVAAEFSDDPYAKDVPPSENSPGRKGNKGDLGYFTVFDMVYPFENGAYNTPKGEVSEIVRSVFGYHLLKIADRKPAMGRAYVAHVYVAHPRSMNPADSAEAERKIREIYAEYQKGGITFEDLAKTYSEDRNNSQTGGVLRWFNTHGLVPEFVALLKNMEVGDVSAPVMTMYGWHMIKLLDQEKPTSKEKELPNIKQRIAKDARAARSREEAISQIKAQFGYQEYPANKALLSKYIDSTIFAGTWQAAPSGILKSKKGLLKIGDQTVTIADFGAWIERKQPRSGTGDLQYLLNERFKEFSEEMVIGYKDARLETLHPEFRALMQEYRDGILLFDLMDKRVWSYAVQDTTGLQQYYEAHKHNYRWNNRVDASVYLCKTESAAATARAMVMAGLTEQEILDSVNKSSALELTLRHEKYQAGDNLLVDANPWQVGVTTVMPNPEATSGAPAFYFVHYKALLPPDVKLLSEVRGLMISQYQEQLEAEWLKDLRARYRVEVNKAELEKLYQ
jgi:peptidyl-prolyl cis-trans isomerase SurA